MTDTDARLLLLAPGDDVLVVRQRIRAGEAFVVDGVTLVAAQDLPIGHKVAAHDIPVGHRILKYGAPIGVATAAIPRGAHVHVHNIRSDYTRTITLDAARAAEGSTA